MKSKVFNFILLPLLMLTTGLAIYGQAVEVLIQNAEAAIEKRDYDTALKSLGAALAKQPQNADALTQRARVYFFQNKMEEAFGETRSYLKNSLIKFRAWQDAKN